jgi:hypothetical protein
MSTLTKERLSSNLGLNKPPFGTIAMSPLKFLENVNKSEAAAVVAR